MRSERRSKVGKKCSTQKIADAISGFFFSQRTILVSVLCYSSLFHVHSRLLSSSDSHLPWRRRSPCPRRIRPGRSRSRGATGLWRSTAAGKPARGPPVYMESRAHVHMYAWSGCTGKLKCMSVEDKLGCEKTKQTRQVPSKGANKEKGTNNKKTYTQQSESLFPTKCIFKIEIESEHYTSLWLR